jgi:iron complex transport system substrate-binding protein
MKDLKVLNKLKNNKHLLAIAAMGLVLAAPIANADDAKQLRIISAGSAVTN